MMENFEEGQEPDRRLRDINLELRNKSGNEKPESRMIVRQQGWRAQFYFKNKDFMFNTYLNSKPEKGEVFEHNGNYYEVRNVIRQLVNIKDDGSLLRERSVKVVVQSC